MKSGTMLAVFIASSVVVLAANLLWLKFPQTVGVWIVVAVNLVGGIAACAAAAMMIMGWGARGMPEWRHPLGGLGLRRFIGVVASLSLGNLVVLWLWGITRVEYVVAVNAMILATWTYWTRAAPHGAGNGPA